MKKVILTVTCPLLIFAHTIDFETSLALTLKHNNGLKAKKLNIQNAKLNLEEVDGYNYGNLIFNENIAHTNNAGYVFGMKMASREAQMSDFGFTTADFGQMQNMMGAGQEIGGVQPDNLNNPKARTNFETKVTYKVPLFVGYKLQNGKKMAQLQLLAKQAQYKYDEKSLGLEVLKAYNGAVASKEFIKATKKAKEATKSFVEFAKALFNEGLVTNIDVKQAQVYDMGVDSKMIEAKNRYELAISYLKFLTSDNTITDVSSFKNINISETSLSSLQNNAINKRDDFQYMKYNTDTMKINIDYEKSSKYPTIGGQVEYGFNDNNFAIDGNHDYYLTAIGLSYTLFDGDIASKKFKKLKLNINKQGIILII